MQLRSSLILSFAAIPLTALADPLPAPSPKAPAIRFFFFFLFFYFVQLRMSCFPDSRRRTADATGLPSSRSAAASQWWDRTVARTVARPSAPRPAGRPGAPVEIRTCCSAGSWSASCMASTTTDGGGASLSPAPRSMTSIPDSIKRRLIVGISARGYPGSERTRWLSSIITVRRSVQGWTARRPPESPLRPHRRWRADRFRRGCRWRSDRRAPGS